MLSRAPKIVGRFWGRRVDFGAGGSISCVPLASSGGNWQALSSLKDSKFQALYHPDACREHSLSLTVPFLDHSRTSRPGQLIHKLSMSHLPVGTGPLDMCAWSQSDVVLSVLKSFQRYASK